MLSIKTSTNFDAIWCFIGELPVSHAQNTKRLQKAFVHLSTSGQLLFRDCVTVYTQIVVMS